MPFPEYLNQYIDNKKDLVKISETVYGISPRIKEQKEDAEKKTITLLIISGLSGAGKDTITKALIKDDRRFGWIKTCTTRQEIRPDEVDEDPYIRLSEKQFTEMENNGDVIESVLYAENHYCSLRSVFEKAFKETEIPILRIDPKGSCNYCMMWREEKEFFGKVNLIYVFIVPPSIEELRERLLKRSGDEKFVQKRMTQLLLDLPYVKEAEYIVINETDKLELVVDELKKLLLG